MIQNLSLLFNKGNCLHKNFIKYFNIYYTETDPT